jgi:hypothetical protein
MRESELFRDESFSLPASSRFPLKLAGYIPKLRYMCILCGLCTSFIEISQYCGVARVLQRLPAHFAFIRPRQSRLRSFQQAIICIQCPSHASLCFTPEPRGRKGCVWVFLATKALTSVHSWYQAACQQCMAKALIHDFHQSCVADSLRLLTGRKLCYDERWLAPNVARYRYRGECATTAHTIL